MTEYVERGAQDEPTPETDGLEEPKTIIENSCWKFWIGALSSLSAHTEIEGLAVRADVAALQELIANGGVLSLAELDRTQQICRRLIILTEMRRAIRRTQELFTEYSLVVDGFPYQGV